MSNSPSTTASSFGSVRPGALDLLLDALRCPVCGGSLGRDAGALRCPAGHAFDIARDGHVSLLAGAAPISGDTAPMVQARQRFLDSGRYAPIRDAVARAAWAGSADRTGVSGGADRPGGADRARPFTVVDAGCGTGYYLAGVLTAQPRPASAAGVGTGTGTGSQPSAAARTPASAPSTVSTPAPADPTARGLGLDASARALRLAARAHPRIAAVACDLFAAALPLAEGSADVVLNVFAPHRPGEFHRILRADGRLVVARPTDRHLVELRAHLPGMVGIDPAKERRLRGALAPFFDVDGASTELVETPIALSPAVAADLVGMTPSARHVTVDADRGVLIVDGAPDRGVPETATVSVLVSAYQPRA